jgi:hypothetical protein
MPTQITINDVTGSTPCNVYLCDNPITMCVYIGTVNSFPYNFFVPSAIDGQTSYNLKVVYDNNCEKIKLLSL